MAVPLATAADATAYGYTLPEADADELLARASVKIRAAAGYPITLGTSVVRLPGLGHVTLPVQPVVDVAEVAEINRDGGTAIVTDWRWYGGQVVHGLWGLFDVTVAYGYATVPDALIELTCSVAARFASTPAALGAGITFRQVGEVSWRAESDAAGPSLLPSERRDLSRILGVPLTVGMVRTGEPSHAFRWTSPWLRT